MMQRKNMYYHLELKRVVLLRKLRSRSIQFAGNLKLKIFGQLSCNSGKRMKKSNRVFFETEKEAVSLGFRPCGHCLRKQYHEWKARQ
jgi:methylphosphotriester-DNA--protein-cysteine methyltransferase